MAYRGRGPRFVAPPEETHRINRRIRAPQVRVIDADGSQAGVMTVEDALRLAESRLLDLVEIAPKAVPPVCRVLDYGKFKYQQHKKEVEAKKKSTTTTVKELRLGYRTGIGDVQRQIDKARAFLAEGDRVKFLLRFRGREMSYQDLGRQKLMGVCEALKDVAAAEGTPRMEGRMMGIVLAPVRKKAATTPKPPSAGTSAKSDGAKPSTATEAARPADPDVATNQQSS